VNGGERGGCKRRSVSEKKREGGTKMGGVMGGNCVQGCWREIKGGRLEAGNEKREGKFSPHVRGSTFGRGLGGKDSGGGGPAFRQKKEIKGGGGGVTDQIFEESRKGPSEKGIVFREKHPSRPAGGKGGGGGRGGGDNTFCVALQTCVPGGERVWD